MTTRTASNAAALARAIEDQGGEGMVVELDLMSQDSIAAAFERIRTEAGDPEVVIYNAGYSEGRSLPKEQELLEFLPGVYLTPPFSLLPERPFLWPRQCSPRCASGGAALSSSARKSVV